MDAAEFREINWKGIHAAVQKKAILNAAGDAEYLGFAYKGFATSAPKWTVEKHFYDGNGNWSYSLSSNTNQIFDNYLTLEYS